MAKTVQVDTELWERMKNLVIALAIMSPLKASSPKTHAEVNITRQGGHHMSLLPLVIFLICWSSQRGKK